VHRDLVGRHPSGCAFFRADGQYVRSGREVVASRAGDVFWRDGTRTRTPKRPFAGAIRRGHRGSAIAIVAEVLAKSGGAVETNQLVMAVGGGDARGRDERGG
jgi:LDH2 family malate/lactate/ureidoglycolate dehydrogenase